jgi:hypothetical protein
VETASAAFSGSVIAVHRCDRTVSASFTNICYKLRSNSETDASELVSFVRANRYSQFSGSVFGVSQDMQRNRQYLL